MRPLSMILITIYIAYFEELDLYFDQSAEDRVVKIQE